MSSVLDQILAHIFGEDTMSVGEVYSAYPKRQLSEGAMVTRFAPSPTGFLHIGGIYAGLISERLAHQSGGLFYLRIEDTDTKRQVEGATELIVDGFAQFGITIDEGPLEVEREIGAYGPYFQSKRKHIYDAFIRQLMLDGKAYVCFATPDQLEQITAMQRQHNAALGYYGDHAIWRDKSLDEVLVELEKGTPYVIRFRSEGSPFEKILVEDFLRGKLQLPENINDIIIKKGDGLPTYHLAHVVDDTLMGTTHVTRGDEWIPSIPVHVQLFEAIGVTPPIFGHLAPIQKQEDQKRRKLSKRSDPEASVSYYFEKGIPVEAVKEYLINLANSKFEEWRKQNKEASINEYKFDASNCNNSGGLLDLVKLDYVAKNVIALMSAQEVYERTHDWAQVFDTDFVHVLNQHKDDLLQVLSIERGGEKSRKDFGAWSDVKDQVLYFIPEFYNQLSIDYDDLLQDVDRKDATQMLTLFIEHYDHTRDSETWLEWVKDLAEKLGYARSVKDFKKDTTGQYKGHFGHMAMVLRIAITGRTRTPDLHEIIHVLGEPETLRRLRLTIDRIAS